MRYLPAFFKFAASNSKYSPNQSGRRTHPQRLIDTLEPRTYLTAALGTVAEYPGVTAPTAIVVGDFNNDGQADLAVAGTNPNTGLPTVAIYLNSGGVYPTTPAYNDLTGSSSAFALATTNINNGSNTDLAVTDPVDGTVVLLLGNGDGTFAAPSSTAYGTPQSPASSPVAYIVSASFTGSNQTLMVTDPADHQIVPLTSNGMGSLVVGTPVAGIDSSMSPRLIVAADFNQDADYDIAFSDGVNPEVFVADGNGSGGFSTPVPTNVAGPVNGLAVADLTTDGQPDLVATTAGTGSSSVVSVLLNTGGVFAGAGQAATTFADPGPVIAADIDGDGIADVVTMDPSGNLDFFHGLGNGSFSPADASQPTTGAATAMASADINGDIRADVLFAETNPALTGGGGIGTILGRTPPYFQSTLSGPVPASGLSGGKIKFTQDVSITNASGKKVKGTSYVELSLSTNTSFSSDDIPLKTIKVGGTINIGKSKIVRASVTKIPSGISPGNYYVVSQVTDPSGGVADSASAATITIAGPQIDLTGAFKKVPVTGKIGKALATTITVTNNGNVPATGLLPISVYSSVDGQLDGTSTGLIGLSPRINIKPGKSATLSLKKLIAPAPAGSYFLIAVLDPNNTLGDVNTSNNTLISPAQVSVSSV